MSFPLCWSYRDYISLIVKYCYKENWILDGASILRFEFRQYTRQEETLQAINSYKGILLVSWEALEYHA